MSNFDLMKKDLTGKKTPLFRFEEMNSGTKSVIVVHSNLRGGAVGSIKWVKELNSYCFHTNNKRRLIFSKHMLSEISNKIESLSS